MTGFRFYWLWFKLGREYWKSRHIWTLMAYLGQDALKQPKVPQSVGDQMAAWLAEQEKDES